MSWRLLIVLVTALALAACSNQETSEQQSNKLGSTSLVVQDRGQVASLEGSYENNRWTRWILEHSPVDVQFVPILRSESKKILNVMFASDSAPDIINETNAAFRNYLYEQKQLMPFDDYLQYMPNYTALLEDYPQLKTAGTKPDGKLYEIGRVNEANPLHVIFIRTDWLEALNLPVPETTEQLVEVAYAFTYHDPDRNGVDDTYGINMSYNAEGAINELFGVQLNNSWGWQDDRIIRQWEKEYYALQFKKELYDLGVVDPKYMNDKDGLKAKQDFINGKIGIYVNHSLNWTEFAIKDIKKLKSNEPAAKIAPLEYPVSPVGQYTGAIDNPIQMTTVLNASTADPVAAARYINFILEPTTSEKLLKGEKDIHWVEGENGCPMNTDIIKWQTEVGYANTGAYGLFLSKGTNPCNFVISHFNPNDSIQQEAIELYTTTRKLYMDHSKLYPGITLGDYLPPLPAELEVIRIKLEEDIKNIYLQAIISGEAYSAEQAIEDAKSIWLNNGGEKLTVFMNDWFRENQSSAFLIEDVWKIVDEQQRMLSEVEARTTQ